MVFSISRIFVFSR